MTAPQSGRDTEATLARHRFFRPMPAALRSRLAAHSSPAEFQTGAALLATDIEVSRFFAILGGRVAIGLRSPHRGLRVIETLHAGDLVGWSWLLPPYRSHFDAIAMEPVQAIAFDAAGVRAHLEDDPRSGMEFVLRVASLIEERLDCARMCLLDLYDGEVGDDEDRH